MINFGIIYIDFQILQNFRIDLISNEPINTSFGITLGIDDPLGTPVILTRL